MLAKETEIKVWLGRVDVGGSACRDFRHLLDSKEQARAESFGNVLLQQRYIIVHGRLRKLLGGILNEAPEKIVIERTEHGKPYLVDYPECAFNLSHTADLIAVAIGARCRLGIDIERCRPKTNLHGLAGKCFSEQELAYWRELPDSLKTDKFFRFWTRKEAFVKAVGRGIALGMNRCALDPADPVRFLSVPDEYGPAPLWHCAELAGIENVYCSVVTDKSIVPNLIAETLE